MEARRREFAELLEDCKPVLFEKFSAERGSVKPREEVVTINRKRNADLTAPIVWRKDEGAWYSVPPGIYETRGNLFAPPECF